MAKLENAPALDAGGMDSIWSLVGATPSSRTYYIRFDGKVSGETYMVTDDFRFKYFFHKTAAITVPDASKFLPKIKHDKIRAVASAFIENISRTTNAGILPISLIYWSRNLQTLIDQACVETWGDLKPRQHDDPRAAEFKAAHKRITDDAIAKRASDPTGDGESMLRSAGQLEVFMENDEVKTGIQAILNGMVASAWTAFELAASDLWEESLNIHPMGLAELSGKMPDSLPQPKKPFIALASPDGERRASSKMVRLDYLRAHG